MSHEMIPWKKITYSSVQLICFNQGWIPVPYKLGVSFSQRSLCGCLMLKPIPLQHTALHPAFPAEHSCPGEA